jgi:hypothetical protein
LERWCVVAVALVVAGIKRLIHPSFHYTLY